MERLSSNLCKFQHRLSSNTVHFHPVNHTRLAMRARHIAQREYDGVALSCSHPRELRVLRIFLRCGLPWCTLDVGRDSMLPAVPSAFQSIGFLFRAHDGAIQNVSRCLFQTAQAVFHSTDPVYSLALVRCGQAVHIGTYLTSVPPRRPSFSLPGSAFQCP
ncbi:unnamed protein product [Trypanosoma congolense IL3000]|uniref:WGS project CAEQ00000000 data, annotated contig 1223 n=1 Tax=Trypanosoma congolense (strain IL3000) TaxID=1068625 RepID=F9W4S9_TRYCI|nr:unnamed protein product [Trypanosoma congolense IL3000]